MAVLGIVFSITVLGDLNVFGRQWYLGTQIAGMLLLVVGVQVIGMGLCAQTYATYYVGHHQRWFDAFRSRFRLEHGLMRKPGRARGLSIVAVVVYRWFERGFEPFPPQARLALVGVTLPIIEVQVFFTSFLLSILLHRPLNVRERSRAGRATTAVAITYHPRRGPAALRRRLDGVRHGGSRFSMHSQPDVVVTRAALRPKCSDRRQRDPPDRDRRTPRRRGPRIEKPSPRSRERRSRSRPIEVSLGRRLTRLSDRPTSAARAAASLAGAWTRPAGGRARPPPPLAVRLLPGCGRGAEDRRADRLLAGLELFTDSYDYLSLAHTVVPGTWHPLGYPLFLCRFATG